MLNDTLTRPSLKWPGGKYRLLSVLKPYLPTSHRLIEPFAGAAALSLNTQCEDFLLNDLNHDLINFYQQLKHKGNRLIEGAEAYFQGAHNNADEYYALRTLFNTTSNKLLRAQLFLYLNRHGYNGLVRQNLKGENNVPFGRYTAPYFPKKELLHSKKMLKRAQLSHLDFEALFENIDQAKGFQGSVIYCDPPYAPLSETANFTSYAGKRFTAFAQETLAEWARYACTQGATVIISNHDLPYTRKLYRGAKLKSLPVSRMISCHGKTRKPIKELIACFIPE